MLTLISCVIFLIRFAAQWCNTGAVFAIGVWGPQGVCKKSGTAVCFPLQRLLVVSAMHFRVWSCVNVKVNRSLWVVALGSLHFSIVFKVRSAYLILIVNLKQMSSGPYAQPKKEKENIQWQRTDSQFEKVVRVSGGGKQGTVWSDRVYGWWDQMMMTTIPFKKTLVMQRMQVGSYKKKMAVMLEDVEKWNPFSFESPPVLGASVNTICVLLAVKCQGGSLK